MKVYKLFKIRKDGSIGSLFMDARRKLPINKWLTSELHVRKGFATRQGWHCLANPSAPHLKEELASGERREFWVVEIKDYEQFERPENQGGVWYLAQEIKILNKYEV